MEHMKMYRASIDFLHDAVAKGEMTTQEAHRLGGAIGRDFQKDDPNFDPFVWMQMLHSGW